MFTHLPGLANQHLDGGHYDLVIERLKGPALAGVCGLDGLDQESDVPIALPQGKASGRLTKHMSRVQLELLQGRRNISDSHYVHHNHVCFTVEPLYGTS